MKKMNNIINHKLQQAKSYLPTGQSGKLKAISYKRGFALTLALLIVSIVTSIGLSVFEIFFIELGLTRNINESQHAFYAADTGGECVLYWDLKKGKLSITTANIVQCNNQTITIGGAPSSVFQLLFNNGTCANVTININAVTGQRIIESLGRSKYDDSTNNCNTSLPKRAERGLELTYF